MEELIRKAVLLNAVKHKGKAKLEPVIGKVLGESPKLKPLVKELKELASSIIEEVNAIPFEAQLKLLKENWPEALEEKPKKEGRGLLPLPNVKKYRTVVTRFSPNPDCVLHLGSIRAIILSHDYARLYGGKFILRFEDTDPRLKRSALTFYDAIREDLIWLGCRWDEEHVQSDRLHIYYDNAEKLIAMGGGYVCTCTKDSFLKAVSIGKPCACRDLPAEEHLSRWRRMLNGSFKEGEAVVRVKTDLNHPNPAVRDWPALRIIDPEKHPHPRVGRKYRVWPLYNFACGIDDHLMGITHIIRGKEHYTNMVRQKYLYLHFGWEYPEAIHYGRLKVVGAELSKSKILESVSKGLVRGFDDPRLATLKSLRRRGITPECLRALVLEMGPKPADVVLSWENINAINRKIVDPIASRYFYVTNPITLVVKGVEGRFSSRIPLHPDHPERGERTIEVSPTKNFVELFVSREDLPLLSKHHVVRLMELFNVEVERIEGSRVISKFHSKGYLEARKLKAPLIHWVLPSRSLDVEVIMPTAEKSVGRGEVALLQENVGSIVQLVRFGFARVDEKAETKVTLYYAHD
ncbi:TPA: glutamate--tRNA ligase [Candidatus Bathyarchaeota archaeon]|nr:glutamate--tRNA ligase [Candidatus Bathyarchaeota archaeon]